MRSDTSNRRVLRVVIPITLAGVVLLTGCGSTAKTTTASAPSGATTPANGSAATSLGTSGATATSASAGTTAPPSTKSTGSGYGGDPCAVIDTATLSSLTGLSGLTATPRGTGVQNGCHWQTGALGVAYDVLPQVLPTDQMIAQIKASAAGDGTNAAIQTVDLGGGHSIVEVTASGVPFASASLLLGDRMVAIVVTLNANKDPAPVGLDVAKAFNAVASALPPAPKL